MICSCMRVQVGARNRTGFRGYLSQDRERLNWTIRLTLQAQNVIPDGIRCILEDPEMITNIRTQGADSDAVASYPSDTEACNVSKGTTHRMISRIDGIEEYLFRMQNINLLSGHVNAIEYVTTLMKLPSLTELGEIYEKKKLLVA